MPESKSEEKITTSLPKGFIVLFPVVSDKSKVRDTVTLDELKGCWSWINIPEGIDEIIITKTSIDDELREYKGTARCRRVIGASRVPVQYDFKIIQQRGGCAIALGCPSFLAKVISALFAQAVCEDPGGFRVNRFTKDEFEKFWNYALKIGGTPREIHLRNVYGKKVSIYHVTGEDILGVKEIGDPLNLMKKAKKIKRLGFSFPPNCLSDCSFHFWIADWGGGTLYEPVDPYTHHLLALANFFQKALSEACKREDVA